MTDFEKLPDDLRRQIIRVALQRKEAARQVAVANSKMQLFLEQDYVEDVYKDIFNNYKLSDTDREEVNLIQNLSTEVFDEAKYLDINSSIAPQSNLADIPAVRLVHRANILQQHAIFTNQQTTGVEAEILIQITNEMLSTFFRRFFRKSDQKSSINQINNYVTQMLNLEGNALLKHTNFSLQEFHDKNAPKHLRGQLKESCNPVFKDTDELTQFIKQYFFLE